MATTTFSTLLQKLSEAVGDFIEVDTTTNITTNTSVISTSLKEYDGGSDDAFIGWRIYITEGNNIAVDRPITDYATATGTLTVLGANLAAESGAVTFRLYRYRHTKKTLAIQNAVLEIFPELHIPVDNRDLVTGNILPPFNWSTTALLDFYTEPAGTLLKNTTGDYIWRGSSNAKLTASGADDYLYIDSDDYPRLLDCMDKDIDYKCWAYPEVADDAFLTIYTVKKDGTAQTLNSTTTTYAGKKCLIKLESQDINDDLGQIQFRMRVHTTAKYSYFDMPRVTGVDVYEYLLPTDIQDGKLEKVYIQTSGYADDACDDLHPETWDEVYGWNILTDGQYKYLRLPSLYSSERQIRLIGYKPLEALSAMTDTLSIDNEQINLLTAYAAYLLFEMEIEGASSEDKNRLRESSAFWYDKWQRLQHLRMPKSTRTMDLPGLW